MYNLSFAVMTLRLEFQTDLSISLHEANICLSKTMHFLLMYSVLFSIVFKCHFRNKSS